MTYSMLALANNSKEALLNPDTVIALANQTFGVFFKHFVSGNVTSAFGGNAYQPIGEKLPWSMGPVVEFPGQPDVERYQSFLGIPNTTLSELPLVNVTIQIPVEQLVMSQVAVFLCSSLLVFLILVTVVMYTANHGHCKKLPRDVDTLASALAFVHGSEKLLAWAETAPRTKPWYKTLFSRSSDPAAAATMARIGPFTGSDGVERWGIELVDSTDHRNDVEGASTIELLNLQPREQQNDDNDGDLATQTSLLGQFGWETDNTSARYSNLTMDEPLEEEPDLGEERISRDGQDDERRSQHTQQYSDSD